jgi:hypothetical protein
VKRTGFRCLPGTFLGKVPDLGRACTDPNELEVPLGFLRVLRKLQGRDHPVVGMRRQVVVRQFEFAPAVMSELRYADLNVVLTK